MTNPKWSEAEPQRGYPLRGGTEWPTNREYLALRAAKDILDAGNVVEADGCTCAFCQGNKDSGWSCVVVIGERTHDGAEKVAAVKPAKNKYGYVSMIFLNCEGVRAKDTVMAWNGVPLRSSEPVVEVRQRVPITANVAANGSRVQIRRG